MSRASRITAAVVLLAISLVVCLVGAVLFTWSGRGVTAHLFLPQSSWLKQPALAPLGPPTADGLEPGLRARGRRWQKGQAYTEVHTRVERIAPRWPIPSETHWRGYLQVTEPGLYRFQVTGTQQVSFALDGRNLGGVYAPEILRHRQLRELVRVRLAPGLHPLAIDHRAHHFHRRPTVLQLVWQPPGSTWQPIPVERLWSSDTESGWLSEPPTRHLPPDAPERDGLAAGHLTGLPMARPSFTGSHFIFAALADRWDFRRFHHMRHFPGYQILWRGRLRVTENRRHRLVARTDGAVRLEVGDLSAEAPAESGELAWSGELSPGWHDLSVSLLSPWPTETLQLEWDGGGAELEPIPVSRLRPVARDRGWFAPRRQRAWTVLALAALGAAIALLALARERPIGARELETALRRGGYALALALILLVGLGLRLYRYHEVPHLQLSADEYHNAHKGWYLLHGEGLKAWTPARYLAQYAQEQIEQVWWADLRFDQVRPNFDRPPLFPMLMGLFTAAVGSADTAWALGPSEIRVLPILLSLLSLLLVAGLTRRIYGSRGAALMAALLFAAVPVIALNHRQAKSDILVGLFVLLGLAAALQHLDTGKRAWMWAAALAAGLAGWSKEIGVVALALVPYVWLRHKRWREGLTVAAVAGAIFALYFAWGSWVDFDLFWGIVRGQSDQVPAFDSAWRFLTDAKLVHESLPFALGWILWLWLAVVYAAPRDELPAVAAVCFLIVTSSVVRSEWIFGWYWLPIYPFLCMAGGVYLYDMVRRPDLVRSALFVLTALFMMIHVQLEGAEPRLAMTRGAVALALLPFAVATFFPHRWSTRLAQIWACLIIAAALILGGVLLLRFE